MGDIGSHAENLATTVRGLTLESICADLTEFGKGRQLDVDGHLLLRYTKARGVQFFEKVVELVRSEHKERPLSELTLV